MVAKVFRYALVYTVFDEMSLFGSVFCVLRSIVHKMNYVISGALTEHINLSTLGFGNCCVVVGLVTILGLCKQIGRELYCL